MDPNQEAWKGKTSILSQNGLRSNPRRGIRQAILFFLWKFMCLVIRKKNQIPIVCYKHKLFGRQPGNTQKSWLQATNVSRILLSGISPKELLYENVHTLWPSLSARSDILFKPSPSTYTGDLGESGQFSVPHFPPPGAGDNYLILTGFCGVKQMNIRRV